MNIVADQLNSKANTQAMLSCFLNDMKQYFKKSPNFSEDKTYTRILKIAETTQKCLPQFYSISNIALKLVQILKQKVDDKFEDQKKEQSPTRSDKSPDTKQQDKITNDDIEALDNLKVRLSRDNDVVKTAHQSLGREVNQEFMRKLVIDSIDDVRDQIEECQEAIGGFLDEVLNPDTDILFIDSRLSNKNVLAKIAKDKRIKITQIRTTGTETKTGEIELADVPSKMRKFNKVIITAESVLKNGSIVAQTGSLMVALAAKKNNIPVIAIGRGFSLTQKVMIDQHLLLAENPMKFFTKTESNMLKTFVAKKFDLIEPKLINVIVNELGVVNPSNIELHFSEYYNYN